MEISTYERDEECHVGCIGRAQHDEQPAEQPAVADGALEDALGVEILPTDTLLVIAWGTARLIDTGTRSPVVRIGRKRVVIIDSTRDERAVVPSELAVVRRDGFNGLEGNR